MLLLFLGLTAGCAQTEAEPEPLAVSEPLAVPTHVVLISVDTLRADHVGAYGSAVQTPHMDALAGDSVRFARAWPTATTTLASHSSMMTGRLPHNHGVPFNGTILDEANTTLAEVLAEGGLSTLGVVGGTPMQESTGIGQGFETFLGPVRPGRNGNISVAAELDRLDGQRTFLFMHYWDAHWPYVSPEPWGSMYRTDDLEIQGTFAEVRAVRRALRRGEPDAPAHSEALKGAYAGAVSYTDSLVGALIEDLKERGMYDNSLLILTSDHGESTDEHWDYWTHGKSTYESAIHVPLLIKLPGQAGAGTVVDTPVSLADLYPTILDLLQLSSPDSVDGVSLVPALQQQPFSRGPIFVEATAPSQRESIDGTTWVNAENCAAVLDGSLKLHRCPWRQTDELYDLSADGMEQSDLYGERAAEAAPLLEHLEQTRATTAARAVRLEDSEEMNTALQALGYID